MRRIDAIKNFLADHTHKDLANLYDECMECQVNVGRDNGERVEGDFKGKQWHGWTDGIQTWKSFRIPYKANSEPEYNKDTKINFDLSVHAEGIGMTGWDWENRVSKWVAFDFDSIVGHAVGLTDQEMQDIINRATEVDWVTIRKSTSGKGIHLYVYLDDVDTENHTEHAALARAILGQLSALTGFDFQSKVDCCGGNMWVWHRKMMGTDGLTLIKKGGILYDIPPNWRDHLNVVKGSRRKNLPQFIKDKSTLSDEEQMFLELTGQRCTIKLDEGHKKLIEYLKDKSAMWWWDNDHHMLVTHTYWLKKAHEDLVMEGIFKTISKGNDLDTQNCFCFPMKRGSWAVRRFTQGVQEEDSWDQDESGWTRCFLNRQPDLNIASRTYSGIEDEKGNFNFAQAELALHAAKALGTHIQLPNWISQRPTILKRHKDGRLIVEIDRDPIDKADEMSNWLPTKNGKWKRIFNSKVQDISEPENSQYDDFVRHLVTESGDDYGWGIRTDENWRTEPLQHIKLSLKSMGFAAKDADNILGNAILKCWTIVNRPFQPEYPGNRQWNRNAAQIRFTPSMNENLSYPTWLKVLNHCGAGLTTSILEDKWCQDNGIVNGADYLKCWIASLLQEPLEPLPYLFFYGPQNSGKSSLHEALSVLLTRGYIRADHAIENPSGFNGELENAIICVIEEINLSKSRVAYNRIKDWVTGKHINIRKMYHAPYHVPNSTHWIQCANDSSYCPVFPGDTRITMCYVDDLEEEIPKRKLFADLEKEAPDFVSALLHLELPRSVSRLNVPVIITGDKQMIQESNETHIQTFLRERTFPVSGEMVLVKELYSEFLEWLDPCEIHNWSKIKFGKEMPTNIIKGRRTEDGQWCYGNISLENKEPEKPKLKLSKGLLRYQE